MHQCPQRGNLGSQRRRFIKQLIVGGQRKPQPLGRLAQMPHGFFQLIKRPKFFF